MIGKALADTIEFKVPAGWCEKQGDRPRVLGISSELQSTFDKCDAEGNAWVKHLALHPADKTFAGARFDIYTCQEQLLASEMKEACEFFGSIHDILPEQLELITVFCRWYSGPPFEPSVIHYLRSEESSASADAGAESLLAAQSNDPWVFVEGKTGQVDGTPFAMVEHQAGERGHKNARRSLAFHMLDFDSAKTLDNGPPSHHVIDEVAVFFSCPVALWDELRPMAESFFHSIRWKSGARV